MYECIQNCQIEVAPGVYRFIQAGQTALKKGQLIKYVKPISRKYFKLSGEALKLDVIDKQKIKKALVKRKVNVPNGASTSALAKLLALDNKRRGIEKLDSLEIVKTRSHIADDRVKKAKVRIIELYELEEHDELPYKDDEPLENLIKMIDDKEAEIAEAAGGSPDDSDGETVESLKAWLKENKVEYHAANGLNTLKKLKAEKEAETETANTQ